MVNKLLKEVGKVSKDWKIERQEIKLLDNYENNQYQKTGKKLLLEVGKVGKSERPEDGNHKSLLKNFNSFSVFGKTHQG